MSVRAERLWWGSGVLVTLVLVVALVLAEAPLLAILGECVALGYCVVALLVHWNR